MVRVAVVTGGSGGIGAATCQRLAAQGWDVCVGYCHSADAAAAVVHACRRTGRQAIASPADVTSEQAVQDLFARADSLGPLGPNEPLQAARPTLGEFAALT